MRVIDDTKVLSLPRTSMTRKIWSGSILNHLSKLWISPEYRETNVIKFNLNFLHDNSFQKLYLRKDIKTGNISWSGN